MGKDNLLIGTARGKLGDIVFYRTGGEQRFRTRVRPTNPRTNAQLIQRCVVSTVVKAYSDFITVCDHAFQNYEGKLKNHQRYMRLNIMAFRPVALAQVARWSPILWNYTLRNYNWASKDDVNTYVNPYILSEGDLPSVDIEGYNETGGTDNGLPYVRVQMGETYENTTYQQFCDKLGLNAGDQLTFVMQRADSTTGAVTETAIARIILMPSTGNMDDAMFTKGTGTALNINNPNKENYGNISLVYDAFKLSFSVGLLGASAASIASSAIIVSRFENNMWRRSNSRMIVKDAFQKLSLLPDAVASYLKSDTSSLYLNQATTGERQALEMRDIELLKNEIEEADLIADGEEQQEKKRNKRQ